MNKGAFARHFKGILDAYGPCYIINLLRYTTAKEMRISTEFVRHVHEYDPQNKRLQILNFDFHGYCGGERYQALKVMSKKCDMEVIKHGWFVENLTSK